MWLGVEGGRGGSNSTGSSSSSSVGGSGGGTCGSSGTKARSNALFMELHNVVRNTAPCALLPWSLRRRLERVGDMSARSALVSRVHDGCSPLFLACKKGNVEVVEYLLTQCGADMEQRGQYEVQEDRSVHKVTPLWCAAVAGRAKVVEVLVQHGADVNSVSDTGSTPVRSACYMTHLDIVKLLVGAGADIQKANYNSGTCLINSVQSEELCEFLLSNGAAVNARDVQRKTALHYAIQEYRVETTKLLLRYKADPHLLSRNGDDALQTASLKGATDIFEHLVDNVSYPPERVASAFELIGSTFLDEHHDSKKALQYWRAACELRGKFGLSKPDSLHPLLPFLEEEEFCDTEQLAAISLDLDRMRLHSLMVCARVLGPSHRDMIYRLMYRGASYADSLQYQRCVELWKHALALKVNRDSILICDTCVTGEALVRLLFKLHGRHESSSGMDEDVRSEDILSMVELLAEGMPDCVKALSVHPIHKRQQDYYNRVVEIVTRLLHLLTMVLSSRSARGEGESKEEALATKRRVHRVVHHIDPRTTDGNSLLHMSCMRRNAIESQSLVEDSADPDYFPSPAVVRLIVDCGAKVNALNGLANSPLHVASLACNFNQEIVDFLLENGAHIDTRNYHLQRPVDLLGAIDECKINPVQYTSLKCLAARVIKSYNLPYKKEIPTMLEDFVEAH